MQIKKSLFYDNNIVTPISVEEIPSRREYIETYKGHLFCTTPGCNAHIDFADYHQSNPNRSNIFRTAKGSEHINGCEFQIINDGSRAPHKPIESITASLNEEHIKNILKSTFELQFNKKKATSSPSKDKAKNSRPKKNTPPDTSANIIPSINPDETPIPSGEREPYVRKRSCLSLLPEDANRLYSVYGYANSSIIDQNFIEITFDSNLNSPVTLSFYNAFKDSSPNSYKLIERLATELQSKQKPTIFICCIGNVELNNNQFEIQVMDDSLITFNNDSIYNYYYTIKAV